MQTRHFRSVIIVLILAVLLAGMFWGGYLAGTWRNQQATERGADDLGMLRQVRDLLKSRFVGDIPDDRTQLYSAIRGLVGAYKDPYTTFLEPAPRRLERDEIRGHFGGIGATLSRDEAGALVLTVMRERPAARAGVQDGDILLAVDGRPITADMPVRDVADLIRGDEGTPVRLTLRRQGVAEPFDIVVIRERIEVPSVEWRVLNAADHIGYVKIAIFGERTDQELQTGLSELAGQGVNRLILDLRGNGGGLVETAVDVASRFLADGVVLYETRRGSQERFYAVKRVNSPAQRWPLAVLVDAGTASAAEIVAGALQDAGRGVLIGEKTYGKGSVQEIHELSDGSSLHVTVARWLTPARHQIDRVGLTPDLPVNVTAADREAGHDPQLVRAQEWLREK